jgi:D-alanyl-D-alanine dipeptidase
LTESARGNSERFSVFSAAMRTMRRVGGIGWLCVAMFAVGGACGVRAPDSETSPAASQARGRAAAIGSDTLAESLLVDLADLDTTIVVEARYAGADNFTDAPLPGYEAPRALLRREAAEALSRVQARLRSGPYGLKVFDGYRPVRATLAMVRWAESSGQEHLLAEGYIARQSRHNLGVAVDLTLVERATGLELDMGTQFDTFSEAAHTANAEGDILRHRQILLHAMEAEGFENYEKEWWHFSYPVDHAVPFDLPIR